VQYTTPTQVGIATNWRTVAAGYAHNLGVRTDGSLWAWGYNQEGQLGDGTLTTRPDPVQIGSASTWRTVSAGSSLYPVSLAIRTDGSLWAWGNNRFGQLGDGTTISHSTPARIGLGMNWQTIDVGFNHNVAVRTDGTLWTWGTNAFGIYATTEGQHFLAFTPVLVYQPALTPLSVQEAVQKVFLTPNPAHEQVLIPGMETTAQLRLLDMQGRLVRTGTGTQLVVRDIVPGLYLLQATNPGKITRTFRLVVD
jgi:alpha-tubulin suppressor-like RCC1 family protein